MMRHLPMSDASAETRRDAYDVRRHPAQLIRRAHQRGAQLFSQAVQADTLTATQFATLATLLEVGPLAQSQLGRRVSMDPSTTSIVMRKLVSEGLIEKTKLRSDMRTSVIALTERGRRCAELHIPISIRAGDELLAPLSPGERALFLELLDRIVATDAYAEGAESSEA